MEPAKLIVDTCVKYDLLPAKRITAAERNKVSKFKKDLMNSNQSNKKIIIDLCLALIKDKSKLNDNIETNYKQEFKDIVNSECYLNTSIEDICVNLSNRSQNAEQNRKKAVEDLFIEREENKRILELKTKRLEELSKENILLKGDLAVSEETRKNQFDKLMEYDSDCEEDTYIKKDLYDNVPVIHYEEPEEPIKYDTPDQSEEEEVNDQSAEEAKLWIEKLAAENEAKREANRKRFS
tara:strand:+ start:2787 stop:3497 length:711 start_codon:yes stop_codon:yes gene_type:complete